MTAPVSNPQTPGRPKRTSPLRIVFGAQLLAATLALLLFLPAGRWDWPEAWIFIAANTTFFLFYGIRALVRDPSQVEERRRPGEGVKSWDRIIMPFFSFFLFLLFPVCGLDAGRYRWSAVPRALEVLAWLGMALAGLIIPRALAVSRYASRMARIQDDRGQIVIQDGPYRYVRHPMYLGIILLFLSIPPALGS